MLLRSNIVLILIVLAVIAAPSAAAAPNADVPQPGDYIVDVESASCPTGGPILRVTPDGQVSTIAQGGILRKPRGNLVLDDATLVVADGWAGLVRVDLTNGSAVGIAEGPPWSPRDVVQDSDGSFIVVDWPEVSATQYQFLMSQPAGGTSSVGSTGGQPQGSQTSPRTGAGPGPTPPGTPGARPQPGSAPGPSTSGPAGPPAVYRVSASGQVTVISQGGKLVNPHGVALDADGNIIVSDGATGVIRVKPDGQQTVVASAGTGAPVGAGVDVRVDADGSYVVADGARGALVRVSPDGTARLIYRGAPFSQPHGPRGVVI
ncbi:MAG TPA: hypothetical protein VGK54_16965, partial [Chloroflexota bacterium]